jgi:hypothetical protein
VGYSGSFYNYCTYRPGNCSSDRRGNCTGAVGSWGARRRPSVGEHKLEGLSLPRRPLVWEDESRRVYV